MQYELDPRLLPPSGASVQCTRCRFVFLALPSGEAVIPSEVSRTSNSSSTQIFGNPYLQQQQQEQAAATPRATKTVGSGVQPARIPVAKPGSGFAQAGATEDTSATLVYGTRGKPPSEEAPARTPERGSATVGAAPASPGKTQVFGALPARPPPSPASTTQVFGAPSLPQGPAPTTTQVFGAVQVPPSAPATTQAFGAASLPATKPPSPTTTQVFGASSIPGAAPKAAGSTTQVFGAGAVRAAVEKEAGRTGSSPKAREEGVPWMAEPGASPSAPRGESGERRAAGSSSGPVPVPPEEPVVAPPRAPVPPPQASAPISAPLNLPPEPLPERGGGTGPSRRLPAFDQAPDMFDRIEREGPPRAAETGGGKERLLIILAAVVVLGLTIWLTYPMWRAREAGLPPEAQRAKDEAVALLRRDDEASRDQAITRLRSVVAQYPKYTEAQAELAVALVLKLDDVKAELELISKQSKRLSEEAQRLSAARASADWVNRVNAARAELENLKTQSQPLSAAVAELTKQVEASQEIVRAAPETEPAADVVARLKAQAVYAGVKGEEHALTLAGRLRKVENPAQWSAIVQAEYGLNASSPQASREEWSQSLQQVRERDRTFIRAYVLGARLALLEQDPATARALLATAEALNPNHTLARKLRAWASASSEAP